MNINMKKINLLIAALAFVGLTSCDYDGSDVPVWLDRCEKVEGFHTRMVARFGQAVADKLFFENARAFFERNETA